MARSRARRQRRHCEYPGCELFARLGSPFCHVHKNTEIPADLEGDETMTFAQRIEARDQEALAAKRQAFADAIDAGDYAKLYTPKIAALIESAAREKGLDTEIGALRVVLAEVIETTDDPVEKGRTAAIVARAIAQVSRTAHVAESGLVEGLQELLHGALKELDGGE
jgi:hypothetical protein